MQNTETAANSPGSARRDLWDPEAARPAESFNPEILAAEPMPFHGGNAGSNPAGVTNQINDLAFQPASL
ncbi:MAG: hypothetical protein ACREEN_04635 [Stellaceae bacterium]